MVFGSASTKFATELNIRKLQNTIYFRCFTKTFMSVILFDRHRSKDDRGIPVHDNSNCDLYITATVG